MKTPAFLLVFVRNDGSRRLTITELGISKSGLLRHLDDLGLRRAWNKDDGPLGLRDLEDDE